MAGRKNDHYQLNLPEYDPDVWPQSVNRYRLDTSFWVYAHNEKQALLSWREFQEVLYHLMVDADIAHDLVRYIYPIEPFTDHAEGFPPEKLSLINQISRESEPKESMVSGTLPDHAWLDPYSDDDFDPELAAQRILWSEYPDDEELGQGYLSISLIEKVGPDGTILPD